MDFTWIGCIKNRSARVDLAKTTI